MLWGCSNGCSNNGRGAAVGHSPRVWWRGRSLGGKMDLVSGVSPVIGDGLEPCHRRQQVGDMH